MKALIFLLLYFPAPADDLRPAVALTHTEDVLALDSFLQILVDEAGTWDFADVTSDSIASRFRPLGDNFRNSGYSTAAYWVRFRVDAGEPDPRRWLLEVADKSLDHVEAHTFPASVGFPITTGDAYPFGTRALRHRSFVFPLPTDGPPSYEVYVRIASLGPIAFPLRIWSSDAFLQKERAEQFFLGIFFGILLIMVVYNLVLFAAIRQRSYLYYTLFIFAFILHQISVERIAFEYFWPNSIWWMERSNSFLALLCAALGYVFTRSYLDTARFEPRLDRVLATLACVCVPMMIFVLIGPRRVVNETVVYFFILTVPVLLVSVVSSMLRGDRAAAFYLSGLSGWIFLLAGVFLGMFGFLGLIPREPFGMRTVQIGAALGITLLSQVGLGYRYDQMRRERERMRLRIATDLHDEIGSGLTQISLYSELVGRATDGQTAQWAEEAGILARRLTDAMQDIIWMIKPGKESFGEMELRMKDFATRLASPRGIALEMAGSVTLSEGALRIELRKDLLLLFKEIIHNAVRHSNCRCITVEYGATRTSLWLTICDDGCGFDPETVHRNNGLRNLEYRAREIHASLSLDTRPGGPTCYRIDAPLVAPPPRTTRTGRSTVAS